ncbi:MAG: hypothetical protein JWP58_4574 [Hymenobacter sp.]|nr:hypothetical protein [Hymenobacter sp.]
MLYLSLTTFFAEQRRRWYDTTRSYPKEYVAGGWAALLQAETVFNKGPLYNAHLETLEAKKELDEVRYKFSRANEKWEKAETQRFAAQLVLKEAKRISQDDQRRAARTRRALERIAEVTDLDEYAPEVRLRYIQELVRQHLDAERKPSPPEPEE